MKATDLPQERSKPLEEDDKPLEEENDASGSQDEAPRVNKICFGVFASMSHEFILDHTETAHEIAQSMQSAFRVLSLTRPEHETIIKIMLKCEGIKSYSVIGPILFRIIEELKE